jgi:hypothetical protein
MIARRLYFAALWRCVLVALFVASLPSVDVVHVYGSLARGLRGETEKENLRGEADLSCSSCSGVVGKLTLPSLNA